MRRGQGARRLAAPIEDEDAGPWYGIAYDLVAVTSQELPSPGDGHHSAAVRIHATAMPVRPQKHLSARMPCTDRVKARVAQDNAKCAGLKVGAGRGADVVRGIYTATRYVEVPLIAGFACLRVKEAGEVALYVVRVALGAFRYVGLDGLVGPRLERNCRHRAVVLDEGRDNFRRAVVDPLSRVTVDQQGKRIFPGQLGNLGLCLLPAVPEPALVMIVAESKRVAANDFRVRRHEADR